mmetsp:Transcript_4560/g.6748  ORF Transcript_4560/g.6748 Transcript_4560/m.6748 type:complete len:575 (-) Transcript_4560:385-2109(-)|eukprot:CAMPEP_0172437444 /NCGR_PEP_ID=MMETSP1064-20121228/72258_1 /TAXON_ID=202472 /ORGANISM="Aulacoseira subarctica , Strain CCAP 1002/5" /LENGTH=574 /DNA_ID=CAMNT_0013185911 /DNA_START=149 /DNA_END=1876 /DNA_ORIENTATION=+
MMLPSATSSSLFRLQSFLYFFNFVIQFKISSWCAVSQETVLLPSTSEESLCRLYVAPSTLGPDAGLGIFAGVAWKQHSPLLPGDIVIPVGYSAPEEELGILGTYIWNPETAPEFYEGRDHSDIVPGLGSLPNCHYEHSNIRHKTQNSAKDAATPTQIYHAGSGSYTPYHSLEMIALQDIQPGMELFTDYGNTYFQSGVPYSSPPSINTVRQMKWLSKYGACVDAHHLLKIDGSTILEAGRGVFAKKEIKKGSVIISTPLIQMHEKNFVVHSDAVDKTSDCDASYPALKLLVNYVLGHPNSTVRLFPYVTFVNLMNHNFMSPNVQFQWPVSSPLLNKTRLEKLSAQHLLNSTSPAGLLINIVAIRDIKPNEEIFLDYGTSWQNEWDKHMQQYNRLWRPLLKEISKVKALEDETCEAIPSNDPSLPISGSSTILSCFYNFNVVGIYKTVPLDVDLMFQTSYPWKYVVNEKGTLGGIYPCKLLSRSSEQNLGVFYTALVGPSLLDPNIAVKGSIISLDNPTRPAANKLILRLVSRIPEEAIYVADREVFSNNNTHRLLPFRHYIGLPDDVFPTSWIH